MKYLTAFLLLAILFLLWEWQCNSPKATTTDKYTDQIASLTKIIEQGKAETKAKFAAKNREVDSLTSIILRIEPLALKYKQDFEKTGNKASEKNKVYKEYVVIHDTVGQLNACAEISLQLDTAIIKYNLKEIYADSLSEAKDIDIASYKRGLINCQTDYDTLQARTERKDVLTVAQNIAIVKKEKKKGFWLFMKGTLVGIILDEIKHLFVK